MVGGRRIIFWGATGQARVLRECLGHLGCELVAVFDNDSSVRPPFADVPIYYGQEGFGRWLEGVDDAAGIGALVAIGGVRGRDRHGIQQFLAERGIKPASVVHPAAFIAGSASMGAGSQILAKAAVCVNVVLGEACIVNTGAVVDHDCVLGNGIHVCPGAVLAGEAQVGDYATIGAGATVLPRITIGAGAIVGAGAVVTRDVPEHAVVYGNPARVAQQAS